MLAYPSLDEGFGFPILEAQCRHAGGRHRRRRRIPRSPATARARPGRRSGGVRRPRSAIVDGALRLGLIEAGQRNVRRFAAGRERLVASLPQRRWSDASMNVTSPAAAGCALSRAGVTARFADWPA